MSGFFQAIVDYLTFLADKMSFAPSIERVNELIEFFKGFI